MIPVCLILQHIIPVMAYEKRSRDFCIHFFVGPFIYAICR